MAQEPQTSVSGIDTSKDAPTKHPDTLLTLPQKPSHYANQHHCRHSCKNGTTWVKKELSKGKWAQAGRFLTAFKFGFAELVGGTFMRFWISDSHPESKLHIVSGKGNKYVQYNTSSALANFSVSNLRTLKSLTKLEKNQKNDNATLFYKIQNLKEEKGEYKTESFTNEEIKTLQLLLNDNAQRKLSVKLTCNEHQVWHSSRWIENFTQLNYSQVMQLSNKALGKFAFSCMIAMMALDTDRKVDNMSAIKGKDSELEVIHIDMSPWHSLLRQGPREREASKKKFKFPNTMTLNEALFPTQYGDDVLNWVWTNKRKKKNNEERISITKEECEALENKLNDEEVKKAFYLEGLKIIACPMQFVFAAMQDTAENEIKIHKEVTNSLRKGINILKKRFFERIYSGYKTNKKQLGYRAKMINGLLNNSEFRDFLLSDQARQSISLLVNHVRHYKKNATGEADLTWLKDYNEEDLESIIRANIILAREIANQINTVVPAASDKQLNGGALLETTFRFGPRIGCSTLIENKVTTDKPQIEADAAYRWRILLEVRIERQIARLLRKNIGFKKAVQCRTAFQRARKEILQHSDWDEDRKSMYLALTMLNAFKQRRVHPHHSKKPSAYNTLYRFVSDHFGKVEGENKVAYQNILKAMDLCGGWQSENSRDMENLYCNFNLALQTNAESNGTNGSCRFWFHQKVKYSDARMKISWEQFKSLLAENNQNQNNVSTILTVGVQLLTTLAASSQLLRIMELTPKGDSSSQKNAVTQLVTALLEEAFKLENQFWYRFRLGKSCGYEYSVQRCWAVIKKIASNEEIKDEDRIGMNHIQTLPSLFAAYNQTRVPPSQPLTPEPNLSY